MQFTHLPVEMLQGGLDDRRRRRAPSGPLPLNVAGHDFQIVEPAQQVLEALECGHEPPRRDPPELVDQLECVPELLCRDSNLVQPVHREHRARIRDGRVEPIDPTRQPPSEQQRTRRVRGTAGRVGQMREFFEQRWRSDLLNLPRHFLAALAAVGFRRMSSRRNHLIEFRVSQPEGVEDAERDVEFPDAAESGRQPSHPTAQLPERRLAAPGMLEAEHGQDLAKATGGDAPAVERLDIVVERRGQVTFEGADAACEGALHGRGSHRHQRKPRTPPVQARGL